VLYATVPGTSETFTRPEITRFDSEELRFLMAADEVVAKEIFDSFRIMSK
jgi:hypothetical protein